MMNSVCDEKKCTGCAACVDKCPQNAISLIDSVYDIKTIIDGKKCVNCNLCTSVCPAINDVDFRKIIYSKQGWANTEIRKKSSSGGAAAAITLSFIKEGGYVASCVFDKGSFHYFVTNNIDEARKFAGSKYVKSNPQNIYKEVKALLIRGEKVLFIGLPCQVAAIIRFCDNNVNLYTVDLICHGTPSQKLLKQFLKERKIDIDKITNIQFREKKYFGISCDGKKITPRDVRDSYFRLFAAGVSYYESCYSCKFAQPNRVSDITLGDAWGQLAEKTDKGVSLVLCQTQKGINLINNIDFHFEIVDLQDAIEANPQLREASMPHPTRNSFVKMVKKNYSVRSMAMRSFLRESIKLSIRTGLIYLHFIQDSPPIDWEE